jgi:maltodextrin utilization protein YvdJ
MTYTEGLKFLIFVMGFPAILSFIVGLFEPAFSPVLFQFGMGMTTMIVLLVYGKKYFA